MSHTNGEKAHGPLELSDVLRIETSDGETLSFEVVGLLEDPAEGRTYAVLRNDAADGDEDEFIVTDVEGNLLEDAELAHEILDEFLAAAQDDDANPPAANGERS
jgi:hypothetical protein